MKERKRNILKRAIRNLPSFQLKNERSWDGIAKSLEAMGREENLKKAARELPSYILPNDIWPGIEKRLVHKEANFKKAIDDLPGFTAPSDLWKKIEEKAGLLKKTQINIYKTPVFRIAASVLLLISLTYLAYRFLMPARDETISVQVELIDNTQELVIESTRGEIQPIFNSQLCKGNPQICSSPQFIELDRQLKELKEKLNTIMQQPGCKNDPQLLKYYYRLENEKVEVEKRMIKLIIQT